jgi:hypothetical protein
VAGAVAQAAVAEVQTTFQKTWLSVPVKATVFTKFVAFEVKAMSVPAASREGSKLGPFAGPPVAATLATEFTGVQFAPVPVSTRQVVRTNTSLDEFRSLAIRLLDVDAYAMNAPVELVEGPAVVRSGVPPGAQVPQIPLSPWLPSVATSTSSGSPAVGDGFIANVNMFEVPPPGAGFKTCT